MPAYDYKCPECGEIQEFTHGMTESPVVKCPECDAVMVKKFCAPQISVRDTINRSKVKDFKKDKRDKKIDLRENYNVHETHALGGKTFNQVYDEVKRQGSRVKDGIDARVENTKKRQEQRQKEQNEKSRKRVLKEHKKIEERAQKRAADARKINL